MYIYICTVYIPGTFKHAIPTESLVSMGIFQARTRRNVIFTKSFPWVWAPKMVDPMYFEDRNVQQFFLPLEWSISVKDILFKVLKGPQLGLVAHIPWKHARKGHESSMVLASHHGLLYVRVKHQQKGWRQPIILSLKVMFESPPNKGYALQTLVMRLVCFFDILYIPWKIMKGSPEDHLVEKKTHLNQSFPGL